MTEITITTGARLHFGFISHGPTGGREFGGVGLMIDRPGFVVRAARAAATDELSCGPWRFRVESLLARLRNSGELGPLRLEIVESPPAHAGLGSGTQLAMAVARISALLGGTGGGAPAELARQAGRGLRSALGLHGFEQGGLLVEAGHFPSGEISPLVARVEFPDEWRLLLIRPHGAAGISGADETDNLARLAPMPTATTDRLCRIALTGILPATVECDFDAACAAIGEFGRIVGEYFALVQGGVFADDRMRRIEPLLVHRRLTGYGQSSWGPTLFVLCPHVEFAGQLAADLAAAPEGRDCEFTIAAPLNRGAAIVCG
ncbi:MAG: beta-RFAP synthase [Planctomycetia bacterium]|nr:beta-RFAP synthase [Planctomycetia bacterium]